MEEEPKPLEADDSFQFDCTCHVPCFNNCCGDLNQAITPYDTLRLRKHLGMGSAEFIETYTWQHVGPESGLPVLVLKPDRTRERNCPFVTPEGCRVYADRPSSCRAYPLARLVSRDQSGQLHEQYFLMQESHCRGFEQSHTQTVREWVAAQELEPYNQVNDLLMDIIRLKRVKMPGPIDLVTNRQFFMACYDLDAFREQLPQLDIEAVLPKESDLIQVAREDDTALLTLGLKWIRKLLLDMPDKGAAS